MQIEFRNLMLPQAETAGIKSLHKGYTSIAALLLLSLFYTSPAKAADCANPDGATGEQLYNETYQVMQYCNGTDWISMGSQSSTIWVQNGSSIFYDAGNVGIGPGTGTPAARLHVIGTTLLDGTLTVSGIITAQNALHLSSTVPDDNCLLANTGDIRYNTTKQGVEVCNGSAWKAASVAGGFTFGSVPFANLAGDLIQDNSNLKWDDINDALTVGKKITFKGDAGDAPFGQVSKTGAVLNDLDDVMVSGINPDEVLIYDGTNWVNRELKLSDLFNVSVGSSPNINDVITYNGTNWVNQQPTSLWQENGANIYYSAGNVGIGTNDPLKELHINGGSSNDADIRLSTGGAEYWNIAKSSTDHSLRFNNGTNRLTLMPDGNLGVGYAPYIGTMPSITTGGIFFDTHTNSPLRWAIYSWNNQLQINTRNSSSWVYEKSPVIIDGVTGNVGIGNVTPLGKLDIAAGATYPIRTSSSQRFIIEVRNSNDPNNGWWLANDANGNFAIHENNIGDRITVQDATGNVGIGTTTPNARLTVSHVGVLGANQPAALIVNAGNTNNYSEGIQINASTNNACGVVSFLAQATPNTSTNAWAVGRCGANFGVFNATRSVQELSINPTTGIMSVTGCSNCSDLRLKKNLVRVGDALSKIEMLNGYNFDWKKPEEREFAQKATFDTEHKQAGLIAQEVEKAFPELVYDNDKLSTLQAVGAEKVKTINYNGLFAPVIEAIKQLASADKDLEAQNAELQKQIDVLKQQLQVLQTGTKQ